MDDRDLVDLAKDSEEIFELLPDQKKKENRFIYSLWIVKVGMEEECSSFLIGMQNFLKNLLEHVKLFFWGQT